MDVFRLSLCPCLCWSSKVAIAPAQLIRVCKLKEIPLKWVSFNCDGQFLISVWWVRAPGSLTIVDATGRTLTTNPVRANHKNSPHKRKCDKPLFGNFLMDTSTFRDHWRWLESWESLPASRSEELWWRSLAAAIVPPIRWDNITSSSLSSGFPLSTPCISSQIISKEKSTRLFCVWIPQSQYYTIYRLEPEPDLNIDSGNITYNSRRDNIFKWQEEFYETCLLCYTFYNIESES